MDALYLSAMWLGEDLRTYTKNTHAQMCQPF